VRIIVVSSLAAPPAAARRPDLVSRLLCALGLI